MSLVLTAEEGRAIVGEDTDDFRVIEDKITGTSRWSELHRVVFERIADTTLWAMRYSVGATEQQDEQPFEFDDPKPVAVVPVEKTITVYVPVNKGVK
jgi:hypothetical protein